jgi:hypothetical protein
MISFLLIIVGAAVTVGNCLGIARAKVSKVNYSCIPLVGGLLGSIGFSAAPKVRMCAWVPLVIDPGCLPMLVMTVVRLLKKPVTP